MLLAVVEKYIKLFPEDKPKLKLLIDQLKNKEDLADRRNFRGHIAGDAIILSPGLDKILYIYHQRSGRWQQPGGHLEQDEEGPWLTAEREAYEETGVKIAKKIGPLGSEWNVPLHIITGPVIPSSGKREPHHWHHDFRYGFIAKSETLGKIQDEGIDDARWFKLKDAIKIKDSGHGVLISIDRLLNLLN